MYIFFSLHFFFVCVVVLHEISIRNLYMAREWFVIYRSVHAVIWRRYHLFSVNIHTSSCYHSTSLRIQIFQYMDGAAIDLHTSWLWLQKIDRYRIHTTYNLCENVPFGHWIRVWFGFGFGFYLFINIFKHRQHNYNQSFKNKLEEARCHEWCALTWNRNINTFAHSLTCIYTRYTYNFLYLCVHTSKVFQSVKRTNERTNEWTNVNRERMMNWAINEIETQTVYTHTFWLF